MVFSSPVFLFLFLPIVLTASLVIRARLANALLLVASLFFYAWGEGVYVALMLASIGLNYGFGLAVERRSGSRSAFAVLVLAVALNLALLGWYKYAGFLADALAPPLLALGLQAPTLEPVHLPIGISFFTFQALSYVVDVYRGTARARRNPFDVALYISLFPQLIAGPIVRFQDFADQIREREVRLADLAFGVERFVLGLGKKVLIANTVAVPADAIFDMPRSELTLGLSWLGLVCYTLQIYFDFSGYSDMAIGLGRMFGFRFRENFLHPYVAASMAEFWRRWHVSLSSWFRDYLYIPLGGNRHGGLRTHVNLVVVFFLTGLWHGASWQFVVWGLYHGAFLTVERALRGRRPAPRPLAHAYVLLAVMGGWVFFRSEDLPAARAYVEALVGLGDGTGWSFRAADFLNAELLLALAVGCVAAMPVLPWLQRRSARIAERGAGARAVTAVGRLVGNAAVLGVLFLSCARLAAATHNPFIYFRF